MRTLISRTLLGFLALLVLFAGCSSDGGGDGEEEVDSCSNEAQKAFVLERMQDIYFWNDELPEVDPDDFATPEALLDALIFKPLDRFSTIGPAVSFTSFFLQGQTIAFGLGTTLLADDDLRINRVFKDSPAEEAGLQRGDRILEINGRTIAEIVANEGISAAFGPREVGVQVTLIVENMDAIQSEVTMTRALIALDIIPASGVFDVVGSPVGYVHFTAFVDPAFDALNTVFAEFKAQGIQDLIIDLRYNGGGLVRVANFVGNLLGWLMVPGEVYSHTVFNVENSFRNTITRFAEEVNALPLNRLVFITTDATASASEIVINGMGPHLQVALIGETTFGKPVGAQNLPFCDKILSLIAFETQNADGFADFFDGLPVDCPAPDDLTAMLGDPTEESLAEALFYLENGACSPAAVARTSTARARRLNARTRARGDAIVKLTGVL